MKEKVTGEQFLAAVRGIPGHVVTQALNTLTSGVTWGGNSKKCLASKFHLIYWPYTQLHELDLDLLVKRCRAKMNKQPLWWTIK